MKTMREKTDKTTLIIKIMAIVIIIMGLFMVFAFVIRPQIEIYDNNRRLEGVEFYVLSVILPQLQQNGFVQIPIGNETLILVQYIPPQEPQL